MFQMLYPKSGNRHLVVRTFENDEAFRNRLLCPGSILYHNFFTNSSVINFNKRYAVTLDSANMTARERCAMENLDPIDGQTKKQFQKFLKMENTTKLF